MPSFRRPPRLYHVTAIIAAGANLRRICVHIKAASIEGAIREARSRDGVTDVISCVPARESFAAKGAHE